MYLWKVVAFQEKIYSHEREIKSPVSFPLSARVLGAHERLSENLRTTTHTTPSRPPLSVFRRRKPAKRLSLARSRREKETYFFGRSLWAGAFFILFRFRMTKRSCEFFDLDSSGRYILRFEDCLSELLPDFKMFCNLRLVFLVTGGFSLDPWGLTLPQGSGSFFLGTFKTFS